MLYRHEQSILENRSAYFPAFDYLRITLAITVAAGHVGLLSWEHSGNLSVQIFFALSGWLIGGILLRAKLEDLPRFYFNRLARIWIPYLMAIFLLVLVSIAKDHITTKWFEFVFYKLTFTYDFFGTSQLALASLMPLDGTANHFWSICAEEQFYLMAPVLILLIPAGKTVWLWCAVCIGALASPYYNYFGSISAGVLFAILYEQIGGWHQKPISRAILALLSSLLFLGIYFNLVPYRLGAPALSICLVLFLAQPGRHNILGEFLGGISFPFYLNHWIGIFAAHWIFGLVGMRDNFLSRISAVLASLAVASILYVAIDQNVKKYRAKLFTVPRGKIAAGVSYTVVSVGLLVGLYLS